MLLNFLLVVAFVGVVMVGAGFAGQPVNNKAAARKVITIILE